MKKIGIILFVLIFTLCNLSFAKHPYHVGSVEINYNEKTKSLEITGKFFIDDLENAVSKKTGQPLQFQNKNSQKKMEEALKLYCQNELKIKVNQKQIPLRFVGYQEDKESVDVYLESPAIPLPKKIDTTVSFLYNLFDDQMNIVHILVKGKRKSDRLNFPNTQISQNF